MTKRLHRLLAWYFALSFAFAGLIAISPSLHQEIEHAGQGPAHTHYAEVSRRVASTQHQHNAVGEDCHASETATSYRRPHEVDLPDFAKLWKLIDKALHGSETPCPGNREEIPGHEHNSLPQLLARGLVEQPLDFPLLLTIHAPAIAQCEFAEPVLYLQHWNAQTASRGPPSLLS